jgi:hypothetical protein
VTDRKKEIDTSPPRRGRLMSIPFRIAEIRGKIKCCFVFISGKLHMYEIYTCIFMQMQEK